VKKAQRKAAERRRRSGTIQARALKWGAALAVVGLVGYAASQMDGIAYGERELGVVNFSDLTSKGKRSALKAANEARCSCGCGMTLAQCVATDSTCPVREGNIDKIRTMVRDAEQL
jgi:hypothetical protein